MSKLLDLNKTVYELVKEYPELADILKELGFTEITKPAMLHSMGRMTTIPKGARMKGISMMKIVPALLQNGFQLAGEMPDIRMGEEKAPDQESQEKSEKDSTADQLKNYLKRLGAGEDLESVREDFAEHFSEVDASEIMQAEQDLMKEGTPLEEVQKLCDVHSALFHGATREEKIANAEKAVEESLKKKNAEQQANQSSAYVQKHAAAKELRETEGHPLASLTEENAEIAKAIQMVKDGLERNEDVAEQLSNLRQISVHYAKKGDMLYPILKVHHSISGPSDVMWTVDDEIRDELAALDRGQEQDEKWKERLRAVLVRADEMIYKEENILFPICAVNFSKEEWFGIYEDSKDYAVIFDVQNIWKEAEDFTAEQKEKQQEAMMDGEIVTPTGHLKVDQLIALMNTLPLELSFIDADDINRYYNDNGAPKVFKRPLSSLDREVYACHPPKIEPMVRSILTDFKEGKRDQVQVWMEKVGKPFLVTYMAVRDKKGAYLGTVEVVQDMQGAKEHFSKY